MMGLYRRFRLERYDDDDDVNDADRPGRDGVVHWLIDGRAWQRRSTSQLGRFEIEELTGPRVPCPGSIPSKGNLLNEG